MNKKILAVILVAAMMLCALVSCADIDSGNANLPDSSDTVDITETPATEAEATTAETTVTESAIQTEEQTLADAGLFGTYIYEGKGAGGDFRITINSDGTFFYYEGGLSSHIGIGDWTIDGDMLCIDDSSAYRDHIHYFKISENQLTFVAEGSNNFIYVKVSDGERFIKQIDEQTN